MIISRTPLRISFFGGGTDYREYYLKEKGAVLGTTLNKYIYVSIYRLKKFFDHKIRVTYSKIELAKSASEIIHPSVRECLKYKKMDENIDIHTFADLPARTGLGSSSAFTVGLLNALNIFNGQTLSKQQLAEEACYLEQEMIQENVGSQDQFHTAFGGLNIIEFSSNEIKVRPVVISKEKRDLLENSLMLFYTGIARNASEIVREQIENTRSHSNDKYLIRMLEMVYQAEKIISQYNLQEMIQNLGELLHEGWELKKKLSSQITTPFIDEVYCRAKEAGAYGGKLCGAGSGGFLALLVNPLRQNSVRQALKNLLEVECRFEDEGSSIIYIKN